MRTKAEEAFYRELETLRYPEDLQRIEHIRHSLAAMRYKRMQKRLFSRKKAEDASGEDLHLTKPEPDPRPSSSSFGVLAHCSNRMSAIVLLLAKVSTYSTTLAKVV